MTVETLSVNQLAQAKGHPILGRVFREISQIAAMELKEPWSGSDWSGMQWGGGDWAGAQWSGGDSSSW
jgi:hypothetical protein